MGALAQNAQAQSLTPLRVDPTLLGLPPIKPAEAPAPAETVREAVEVTPVDVSTVEATNAEDAGTTDPEVIQPEKRKKASRPEIKRPVQAAPDLIPARAVAPDSEEQQPAQQNASVEPAPAPVPKAVEVPLVVPPSRPAREDEREQQRDDDDRELAEPDDEPGSHGDDEDDLERSDREAAEPVLPQRRGLSGGLNPHGIGGGAADGDGAGGAEESHPPTLTGRLGARPGLTAGHPGLHAPRRTHSRSVSTRATVSPIARATTMNTAVKPLCTAVSVSPEMTPVIDR